VFSLEDCAFFKQSQKQIKHFNISLKYLITIVLTTTIVNLPVA